MTSLSHDETGGERRRIPYAGYDPHELPGLNWGSPPRVIGFDRKRAPKPRDAWYVPPAVPYDYFIQPPLPRAYIRAGTGRKPMPTWPVDSIINEVAEKHKVTVGAIHGESRRRHFVAARQEAMYRLSEETGMSLTAIGRTIGLRDRTTVIHGILKHKERAGLG